MVEVHSRQAEWNRGEARAESGSHGFRGNVYSRVPNHVSKADLSSSSTAARRAQWRWFGIGLAIWVVIVIGTWPAAFSFFDEVGYVGQTRLLLDSKIRPDIDSVGYWTASPGGVVPVYPLVLPLLLTPLFAIAPPLVFLLGFGAAAALAVFLAVILDEWREEPALGLLVLVHPTVALLARTAMGDLLLCVAAVAAWLYLQRGRTLLTLIGFAATVMVKPTGVPIAAGLILGEGVSLWLRSPDRRVLQVFRPLGTAVLGCGLGGATVLLLNVLTTGEPGYAYIWMHQERATFALEHLLRSGVAHGTTLLLFPPALVAGLWCLWRRRALGPVFAVVFVLGSMSMYRFVDQGRETLDNLVLSPRLILPAVVFLLLGYADLISRVAQRFHLSAWLPPALQCSRPQPPSPLGFCTPVGKRRCRRPEQRPSEPSRSTDEAPWASPTTRSRRLRL